MRSSDPIFTARRVGYALIAATLITASAGYARLPDADYRGVYDNDRPVWLLGGRPELSIDRVQRFTRRADPAQRAAVARIVAEEAQAHGVPVALALAVATQESGMRPSHAVTGPPTRYGRAVGTLQILPSTGRSMGCGNLRDTRHNARCGVRYLQEGLRRCGGDVECAARFHHGGPNLRIHGRLTHGYGRAVVARMARLGAAPTRVRIGFAHQASNEHFVNWWLTR